MKKFLAAVLSVIMLFSVFAAISIAESFDATAVVTATTDGSTLRCIATITNKSDTAGYVTVYKSVFSEDNKSYDMVKEKIAIPAGNGTKKRVTIYQNYDRSAGEYAMMHFWINDTMNPVCDPVLSTDAEEAALHLFDNVGRTTDETNGAGSALF